MNNHRDREAVILSAARTPSGRFLGALSGLTAAELGQAAVRAAVERSGVNAEDISELFLGNVVSAGVGQALPRQVSIGAGLPETVGGTAINKVCGSSLKAIMLAASAIRADEGDLYVAAGVESMSRAPFLDDSHRKGHKYGHVQLRDALLTDGLWCTLCDWSMGDAAEFIANQIGVSRDEMDALAFRSHQNAINATDSGKFRAEIVPLSVKNGKETRLIDQDEPIRRDTSLEALAKLPPAFQKDGKVTAGNAPGMNDGAAAV
ncbi:MAG: acetyl-CoA C-acyltransferase, partial [Phototrophicales bacterium]